MSLLHLNRSVLTFHVREIVEQGHRGNTFALLGLGAMILAPSLFPAVAKTSRPLVKAAIKGGLSLVNTDINLTQKSN
ncbi:MAG: hypothetical protein ACFB02_19690 [Mastigocoleus sp.]